MKLVYLYGMWLQLVVFVHAGKDDHRYHVTFLGRNTSSLSSDVGYIYGSSDKLQVRSEHEACTDVGSTKLDDHTWTVVLQSEACRALIPNGTMVSNTGMRVTGDGDFQLYVYQKCGDNEGDGYAAIPDEHVGKLYYVITHCPNGGICQFAITSTTRETKVLVEFPPALYNHILCNGTKVQEDKFIVELGKFDTLHFESHVDLSGTFIRADKRVGVIVGARDVMSGNTISCLIEQLPPINKWGKVFTIISFKPGGIQSEHVLKIVTRDNGTKVQTSDGHQLIIPVAGQFVELRLKQNVTHVITSEPVLMLLIITLNDTMSMVQVQPTEQCSNDKQYYYCKSDHALVNLVSDSETPAVDRCDLNYTDATYIVRGVTVCDPREQETKIDINEVVCGYGMCDGVSAVFIGADWKPRNTICRPSVAAPGDDRDNDCDGLIDEDPCTENTHLGTRIPLTSNGMMTYWSVNSLSSITLTIDSPTVLVLSLQSSHVPYNSIHFYVQANETRFTVCKYSANCTSSEVLLSPNHLTLSLDWKNIENVTVNTQPIVTYFNETDTLDVLVAANYFGLNAGIKVGESTLDCGKIYKGDGMADDLGKDFILPMRKNHLFMIFILAPRKDAWVIFYDHDTDSELDTMDIDPNKTTTLSSTDIFSSFTGVRIESSEVEISVYLAVKKTNTAYFSGRRILPLDILGHSYHLFFKSTLTDADDNLDVCEVYAIKWTARLRGINKIAKKTDPAMITYEDYKALGEYHLLQADYPVAVFCGEDAEFVQIPPKETLGKRYFIPPLPKPARVQIVRTEADTETYNITGTGPIQVHLLMQGSNTVIPSTDQYGVADIHEDIADELNRLGLDVEQYKRGVDENGTHIPDGGVTKAAFNLTLVDSAALLLMIPSRTLYSDINKACILDSDGGLGDDGYCNGLSSILLNTSFENIAIDCPIHLPTNVLPSNTSVEPPNPRKMRIRRKQMSQLTDMPMDDTLPLVSLVLVDYSSSLPEILPGDKLHIRGIEPDDDGCTADCVCPCAWKYSINLSEEQIRARIQVLHDKLKLDTHSLSKTIRKLSSATDFRTESQAVGAVSIVWSCLMFGALLVMDINHIRRDLKTMFQNLRQACGH